MNDAARITIANATPEQLAEANAAIEARLAAAKEPVHCLYCEKRFTPTRAWQRFCSPLHKTAYARRAVELELEFLRGQIRRLQQENAGLLRELGRAERRAE